MAKDRFSALWVSHSSISDWLACPRAYYLKNVYRDPKTRHKLTLMSPPLALGQVVHEVIEGLSTLAVARRFSEPLTLKFDRAWPKVSRYFDQDEAAKYKEDAVHIIDFKTGKNEESQDSLQLKIYYLLASHTQERPVAKLSYWYLDLDRAPKNQNLPDPKKAEAQLLKIAKEIKLARKLERFKCPHGGCRHCQPYEDILAGKAEFLGVDPKGYDLYIRRSENNNKRSEIL